MENTYQFKDQNMLQHGEAVHNSYVKIIQDLNATSCKTYQVYPELLIDNWELLGSYLLDRRLMKIYHTFHDCGKPFTREVGENGKQHFPNHAQESASVFLLSISPELNLHKDEAWIISNLIRDDMTFHCSPMDDIKEYISDIFKYINTTDNEILVSLWLTNFAELYANKKMFDCDSQTSFKIKQKKLLKVLKLILTEIKG